MAGDMITITLDSLEEESLINLRLACRPMQAQAQKFEREIDERFKQIKAILDAKDHRVRKTMAPIAARHDLKSIPENYVPEKERDKLGRQRITFPNPDKGHVVPPKDIPPASPVPAEDPKAKPLSSAKKVAKKRRKKAARKKAG
jgi:hypothetical protein